MWTPGCAKNVLLASIDAEGDDMLPITKLADFGTVRADVRHRKFSGQATSEHNMESHGVTKQIIGTRPYMSYGAVVWCYICTEMHDVSTHNINCMMEQTWCALLCVWLPV